jgi:pyruvate,water dikinase
VEIITDYPLMELDRVGGKFHAQARLRELRLPVPDFFCLSRQFFDRSIKHLKGQIAILLQELEPNDRGAVEAAANRIRELMLNIRFDRTTQDKIYAAFDRALPDAQLVSVRACMLAESAEASEDSATNPFAGMSETFLYVERNALLDHVKQCWASGFSAKAIAYRLSQGLDPTDVGIAVGIQRMIFGRRSFVLFTCDPNTAARDTLIVAGYGIGEGVVQEAVPVDHYFIGGKSDEIRSVIADKNEQLDFDSERGHGICRKPVDAQLRARPCLSNAELRELQVLGRRVEHAFGRPQDIEGTIDDQGNIHLLQARPIAIDHTKKRVWTGLNITESYPGVSAPLTYSLAKLFYRVIFRDVYRRLGVTDEKLRTNRFRLERMIGYIRGRIYYSLNAFYLLHGLTPLFRWMAKPWENMIGLRSSYWIASGENDAAPGERRRRWESAKALAVFCRLFLRHPRAVRAYKQWWIARARQSRAVVKPGQDALVLTEEFYRLWRDVGENWGVTLVNDAYIFTLYALVSGLFKRWKLDEDPALLSNLLCGGSEIESVEIFLSVLRIVEHIRSDAACRKLMSNSEDKELVLLYKKRRLPAELMSMLDSHIERYGDRSMEELKMETPSLRDDPAVLFAGIRRFLKSDLDVESCRRAEDGKRADAEATLMLKLGRWSLRRKLLLWLVHHLREMIAHRENSRYCRSELFGICRDIFRIQGHYLANRGAIDAADDVYFLTVEEVMGYADGTGVDENFREAVARRKRQVEAYQADEVPETLFTDGALRGNRLSAEIAEANGDGNIMRGLGSSMGTASGVARVVLNPNEIDELPRETILVAKETDPGWLFLMLASSGIVVERGSMLSHTAITGRKFGIPTIVGVDRATSRIPDGVRLEIDGGSGIVKILEASE